MSAIDAITRIRNASSRKKPVVEVLRDRFTEALLKVLQREGYIWGFETKEKGFSVQLKYGVLGNPVIQEFDSVSKSSRRDYKRRTNLEPVLGGLGIAIISTPQGLMSDREARRAGLGGEVIARVA